MHVKNQKGPKGRKQQKEKNREPRKPAGEVIRDLKAQVAVLTQAAEATKAEALQVKAEALNSVKEYKQRAQEAMNERDSLQSKVDRLLESNKTVSLELADARHAFKLEHQEMQAKFDDQIKAFRDRIEELKCKRSPDAEALAQLREVFAAVAHSEWSGWLEYMFRQGTLNEDEDFVIPKEQYRDWLCKRMLKYRDLPEGEQKPDATSADKYIAALQQFARGIE